MRKRLTKEQRAANEAYAQEAWENRLSLSLRTDRLAELERKSNSKD